MVYALELYRLHSPILHWLQHVRCRRPYPLLFHFLSLSSARSSSSSASLSLSLTHYVARSRCERVLFIQYRPVAVCSLVLRFQTSCAVSSSVISSGPSNRQKLISSNSASERDDCVGAVACDRGLLFLWPFVILENLVCFVLFSLVCRRQAALHAIQPKLASKS